MVPDLSRITAIAELLDDPELAYPTIHITGTNGKTTTARVATTLACAHGLTTGLYTSPHLLSVTERLQVCGRPIDEAEFAEEYEHLLPYLQTVDARGERVTYFEAPTALDHPELGSTVEQVATEKAGIIKPGKTVVCREQPAEAMRVIAARSEEYEATVLL